MFSGISLVLAGCANLGPRDAETGEEVASASDSHPSVLPPYKGGGYYQDDGPGANPPPDLHKVPDAVPKAEPVKPSANRTYQVFGRRYYPDPSLTSYEEVGLASWYGRKYHGRATSSGEPYDMYGMSAAHRTLPIPSYVRVTNLENDRSVVVRINDRGPFHRKRIIDLSYTAAYKLDLLKGVGKVKVTQLQPDDVAEPGSFAAGTEDPVESVVTQPLAVAQEVEPAPNSASKVDGAPASMQGAIYIQVGAYSQASGAEQAMQQLTKRLGRMVPSIQRLDASGLFRVQVGPYAEDDEAERAIAYLREELGLKPFKIAGSTAKEQTATPPAAPAQAKVQVAGSAHWLQLAAYANPGSADALFARMLGRTDLPGLQLVEAGGLTKVQAGPYPSAEQAEQAAVQLASALGYKPYKIVR